MAEKETQIGRERMKNTPQKPMSFKLKEKSVKTSHLDDNAVTADKIANGAVQGSAIAEGSVGTSNIADGAVTTSKMGDSSVTTDKIASESVTNQKIADNTITSDKIADEAITGSKIAPNTITGNKLADGAITSVDIQDNTLSGSKLMDGTISGEKLMDSAVSGLKIKDNTIDGRKIADGTIQSLDIQDNSIPGSKLADGTITTEKLQDGIISNDKLANGTLTGSKFLDESITGEKIMNGTIPGSKIMDDTIEGVDIVNGSIDGSKLKTNSVDGSKLADDAVDYMHLKANSVTNDKIADDAVSTEKIKNNTITGAKFADGSITTDKLDGTFSGQKIADNTLVGSKIVDNTITGDKIVDNTVPGSKLQDGTIQGVDIQDGTLSGAKLVDGSVSGAKIADNAITSSHLLNNSIPGSKIQDGTIENVDLKDNTLDGSKLKDSTIQTAKIADSAVTEAKLAANAVTTDKIDAGAVTTAKIANEAVTEAKIDDDAVTSAKIASGAVTTDKILNDAVTTNKIDSGAVTTSKIADTAVTESKIDTGAVTEGKIASNAVTNTKIADGSVTEGKIGALAVTEGKIASNAVTEGKIAAGAVSTAKLADGSVTTGKIVDANVTTAKIADDAVTEAKIADGAITSDKIADEVITELQTIMDDVPTKDSVKPVSSGGTYNALETKANKNGYYETLGAGTATNLKGDTVTDNTFIYRQTGGSQSVASGSAQIEGVKGNTVKWNQLVRNGNFSNGTTGWTSVGQNGTFTTNVSRNVNTITVTTNCGANSYISTGCNFVSLHKYYFSYNFQNSGNYQPRTSIAGINNIYLSKGIIRAASNTSTAYFYLGKASSFNKGYTCSFSNFQIFDLTEIFGADNEPETVEAFESWLATNVGLQDYYPYDAGSLIPVKMTGIKSIGYNQYNYSSPTIKAIKGTQYKAEGIYTKLWQSEDADVTFAAYTYGGAVTAGTIYSNSSNHYIGNKNVAAYDNTATYAVGNYCSQSDAIYKCNTAIAEAEEFDSTKWDLIADVAAMVTEGIFVSMDITPDANGVFTPTEQYVHVEGGNATTTCIHFASTQESGYKPYSDFVANLDVTQLKGRLNGTGDLVTVFPVGMKKAGSAYDEIKVENGQLKAIKRFSSIDLGLQDWWYPSSNQFRTQVYDMKKGIAWSKSRILTAKYIVVRSGSNDTEWIDNIDKSIHGRNASNQIIIHDSGYSDVNAFTTAMSGVMLYYERATYQEYILEGVDLPMGYKVENGGTEEVLVPAGETEGEVTSCAPTLGIRYSMDAVGTLKNLSTNYMSMESMDQFLYALGGAMNGTWTKTWDSQNNRYSFSFTPNAEPEPEPEPEP